MNYLIILFLSIFSFQKEKTTITVAADGSGDSYSKIPFLIRKYSINYAYSGNLWLTQNKKTDHHAPKGV